MLDKINWKAKWIITKFKDREAFEKNDPFQVKEIDYNLLLNEGIAEMWDLVIGATATAFDNTNAYIGVGDSSTAEAATQTGLQATTNKLYKAMQATYPQRSGQTVTWRSQFTELEANFAWNEFTVANGSSDSADNMNRKVSAEGTKVSGQIWTVDLAITLS